jgi:hypothetical protein
MTALLAGCDGQAGSDYHGEPLAELTGTVNNESGQPPATMIDAVLLWRAGDGNSAAAATPVVIEKMFPAQFTITLYQPPPEVALHVSSLPFAVANLGAIRHGADLMRGDGLLGSLADPQIYYVHRALPADGPLHDAYGALAKGYHYVSRSQQRDPATLSAAEIDDCATRVAGAPDGISLSDAQTECRDNLLSQSIRELPLTTPVVLRVKNP